MDGKLLAGLAQLLAEAVNSDPDLIGVMTHNHRCEIHVVDLAMSQFAPLDQWTFNTPRDGGENNPYPYQHYIDMGDVRIFAITHDRLPEPQVQS